MNRCLKSVLGAGLLSLCCQPGAAAGDGDFSLGRAVCDEATAEMYCDGLTCDGIGATKRGIRRTTLRDRVPAMLGDFFGGSQLAARGSLSRDRLLVFADDLDAPAGPLNPALPLTITEPGPVGIFETSLMSVQQAQTILRGSGTLPSALLTGTVTDNATLTTSNTV